MQIDHALPPLASLQWPTRPDLALPQAAVGQVLLLLFWRLDCAHSRVALAEVARLAERFLHRVVAVLVHVPTTERERQVARVLRCTEPLPVLLAVDALGAARRACGVRALPTLVLVDAQGKVRAVAAGEPSRARLQEAVVALLREMAQGGLDASLPLLPQAHADLALQPTALLADGQALWVGSRGHGCLYRIAATGQVLDKATTQPRLHDPAAMTRVAAGILVADRAAHVVHLVAGEPHARVVVGSSQRGHDRVGGGYGDQQALAMPSGLCSDGGMVVIANSGVDQLWQLDVETGCASAWLGADGKGLVDGGEHATFSQPEGLCRADGALFVADAGHGAVRCVDLAHSHVRTLCTGLQEPCAVAVHEGKLWVADRAAGMVLRGPVDGVLQPWLHSAHGLQEPHALAVWQDALWIADGSAGLLRIALTAEPDALQQVVLQGQEQVAREGVCLLAAVHLREHSDVVLRLVWPHVAGDGELCTVGLGDEGAGLLACEVRHAVPLQNGLAIVQAPVANAGTGALRIRMHCVGRQVDWLVPLTVSPTGVSEQALAAAAGP